MVTIKDIDFDAVKKDLIELGFFKPKDIPESFHYDNADALFKKGMQYFIGNQFQMLNKYLEIVKWMDDNEHKGLTLMGTCGQGKTIFARYVLPLIINYYQGRYLNCYDATYMAKHPDEVIGKHLIMVDDVGTEDITNNYGNKRDAFSELCDAAEKAGKFLVITTNLTGDELAQRYGDRTVSRLKSLTKLVTLAGKDLRK